jgi:hypothetical protein
MKTVVIVLQDLSSSKGRHKARGWMKGVQCMHDTWQAGGCSQWRSSVVQQQVAGYAGALVGVPECLLQGGSYTGDKELQQERGKEQGDSAALPLGGRGAHCRRGSKGGGCTPAERRRG